MTGLSVLQSEEYAFDVCTSDPRVVPHNPDRILYNKVPKCGSRTLSLILSKAGMLNDHTVKIQTAFDGVQLNLTEQVHFKN